MAKDPEKSPKLRENVYNVLAVKPGENEPGCWGEGPGRFSMSTATDKALIKVAKDRGWEPSRITHVRVSNVEGDTRIWLRPTDKKDPNRIPVRRYKSRLSINLSPWLVQWNMALPSDERRRYDILPDAKNESPVGPALYIDLAAPLQTVKVTRRKSGPASQAAASTQPPAPSL